jgi:hypothetical protein
VTPRTTELNNQQTRNSRPAVHCQQVTWASSNWREAQLYTILHTQTIITRDSTSIVITKTMNSTTVRIQNLVQTWSTDVQQQSTTMTESKRYDDFSALQTQTTWLPSCVGLHLLVLTHSLQVQICMAPLFINYIKKNLKTYSRRCGTFARNNRKLVLNINLHNVSLSD